MNFYAEDLRRIRKSYSGHVASTVPSRSFVCRTGTSWAYGFTLTWAPGSISVSGDVGEIIVRNHGLGTLKSALRWAAGSDYDYLLSKSEIRQSYDAEATARYIIEAANREAASSLQTIREELQWWRRCKPDANDYNADEYTAEMERWRADRPTRDHLKCRDSDEGRPYYAREDKGLVAPDGWDVWLGIWKGGHHYGQADDIFTRAGRSALAEEVESLCENHDRAVGLAITAGIDGYYGEYRFTFSDLMRVEAVRIGARLALNVLKQEEFDANPYAWTDCDFWGNTTPPRTGFEEWVARAFVDHAALTWDQAMTMARATVDVELDMLDQGYNRAEHRVHTRARYGCEALPWTPEDALRMALDELEQWREDAA
ncbi:hypothetical protein [Brevundimonas nasdae]|uniref:hypothetical protein n=1 Tax=Brevundimonas nasdae TaxID=172043 RepID=UPI003F68F553